MVGCCCCYFSILPLFILYRILVAVINTFVPSTRVLPLSSNVTHLRNSQHYLGPDLTSGNSNRHQCSDEYIPCSFTASSCWSVIQLLVVGYIISHFNFQILAMILILIPAAVSLCRSSIKYYWLKVKNQWSNLGGHLCFALECFFCWIHQSSRSLLQAVPSLLFPSLLYPSLPFPSLPFSSLLFPPLPSLLTLYKQNDLKADWKLNTLLLNFAFVSLRSH